MVIAAAASPIASRTALVTDVLSEVPPVSLIFSQLRARHETAL
jgi:hypothetical protein